MIHHDDIELRDVAESQDGIGRPTPRRDSLTIESQCFFERPADALDDCTFDLIDEPVRVDDKPCVDSGGNSLHAYSVCGPVDLNVRDQSYIGLVSLVAHKGDPATPCAVLFFSGPPIGALRGGPDDRLCPLVLQMPQPVIDWVSSGQRGEFVHEGLDGENVAERAKGTQRRNPHRHRRQKMFDDPLAWEIVIRNGVAVGATRRQRDLDGWRRFEGLGQMPGSQEIDAAGYSWPHEI